MPRVSERPFPILHWLTVEDRARFYGIYQALMERWRPLLSGQLLELDYEELVSDLPTQARRLIHFLGLDWDDACLSTSKRTPEYPA